MSILDELIPIAFEMIINNVTGTFNLTNPGVISHNEILEMYRDIVDPTHTWENMSVEEQDKLLLGKRSNNFMDTQKLEIFHKIYASHLPLHNIKEGLEMVMEKYNALNKI
jgi:NAD dependent epimerase/dehydratase family enzyme